MDVDWQDILLNEKTCGKEKAIAGQEKTDEEAGFGENNKQDSQPAKVGDEFDERFHCCLLYHATPDMW